jgi:transposase
MKKGNQRGPAYAYNIKALRNQEMAIAEQAERAYQHFVAQWQPTPTTQRRATNPAAWSRGAPRQPG